jgi:pyruvate dehydrogenase E1 component alpha subunit
MSAINYSFTKSDPLAVISQIGKEKAFKALDEMLLIRNFEQRGEKAYQDGKVWGFYHAYIGQEAIQTAAISALGSDKHLWLTSYRCHALALLLGMSAKEGMAELFGKESGNAKGRGGSMHMYTDNMFGGDGIVGGQWAVGAGLAFSLKYQEVKDQIAICFGGDGSVMQGTFHETMNLATLWKLPLLIVIENNGLGMGTQIQRAIAKLPIGENLAKAYGLSSYTVDGMDFADCYEIFQKAHAEIKEKSMPIIIEMVCNRFRGHSISDSAHYRTKDDLIKMQERDPIVILSNYLLQLGFLTEDELEMRKKIKKDEVLEAVKFAEESSFPDIHTLEEGVIIG